MKKFLLSLLAIITFSGVMYAHDHDDDDDHCMGPGMMWGNGYYGMGPGMMWHHHYWDNDDWHHHTKQALNLTTQQHQQWDKLRNRSEQTQEAVNDSINMYAKMIYKLQKNKSSMVQQDLDEIKQILTPQQYTRFLERLVTMEMKDK